MPAWESNIGYDILVRHTSSWCMVHVRAPFPYPPLLVSNGMRRRWWNDYSNASNNWVRSPRIWFTQLKLWLLCAQEVHHTGPARENLCRLMQSLRLIVGKQGLDRARDADNTFEICGSYLETRAGHADHTNSTRECVQYCDGTAPTRQSRYKLDSRWSYHTMLHGKRGLL